MIKPPDVDPYNPEDPGTVPVPDPCATAGQPNTSYPDAIPVDMRSFYLSLLPVIPSDAFNINIDLITKIDSNGDFVFQLTGGFNKPDGSLTVFTPITIGKLTPYDTVVNNLLSNNLYQPDGPVMQYNGGTVQNFNDGLGGRYAAFTDASGNVTVLPDVYITTWGSFSNGGVTLPGGMIYADSTFGLAELQHEYGHFLQEVIYGPLFYLYTIMPASGLNAATTTPQEHDKYWTETGANALAKAYFGPNSAISNKPRFKTIPC